MEGDHRQPSAHVQVLAPGVQHGRQGVQLAVDGDADGLKAPLGGVLLLPQRLWRHGGLDDVHQLKRRLDGSGLSCPADALCDGGRVALLAEVVQDAPQLLIGPLVHHLTNFDCSENDLKSLDVSHNAILATLDCYWTGITALDLSKNTALGKLNCSYNSIGTLDLSNNKALFSLSCYNCELGSLDLSNNTELEEAVVKNNELTSLTVSSNTKLLLLDVQNNEQLKSIDASMLTDLEELQCSYTGLTALDVTHNTKLVKLICSNNKLTTLDLSKNTLLERLFCDGNQLTSLDLSNNTKLNYLECSGNGMSACALNDLYYNLPKCSTTPTNVNMFIAGINNPNEAEGSETSMATKKGWKVSVDGDGSGCNEAYITIEPTENGTLELRNSDNEIVNSGSKVIKNTTVTVKGNPDEGFYLKNVWVNGVSVTNGEFVVKMASVVTAAFDEGSSITEIENSGMKIWSTPGIIRVNAENAHVQVYSTSGALVWEGNIYQEKTIDATRGIYIVKVRNAQSTQSKKIVVE